MSEKNKEESTKKNKEKDCKKVGDEIQDQVPRRYKQGLLKNSYQCLCCGNIEEELEMAGEDWGLTKCKQCGLMVVQDKEKCSIKEGRLYKGEYLISKLNKFFRPARYEECVMWLAFYYERSVKHRKIKLEDLTNNVLEDMKKHCKYVRDRIEAGIDEEELNRILTPAKHYAEKQTLKIKEEYEKYKK